MKRILFALAASWVLIAATALLSGPQAKPLPVKGLGDTGIGYSVCVQDASGATLGMVEVPYHVVNPEQRSKRGLPPLELSEFEASVRNAATLVVGPEAASKSTWTCATTIRDNKGVPIGCGGACGDCVIVRVRKAPNQ